MLRQFMTTGKTFRVQRALEIGWKYLVALARYHLVTPWFDFEKTNGLITAVLRYDFKQGAGRRLPTVSIYDLFPELESQNWRYFGVRTIPEGPYLCGIAKLLGARNILEIGTYHGATTLQLAANLPENGQIVTVDLDPEQVNRLDIALDGYDAPLARKDREQIGRYYKNSPYAGRVVQVIADSATVDYTQYADRYDLVFIDGGHSYTQIKRDTEKTLPLVRPGGVMCWHDYHAGSHGVTRYLHELGKTHPIRHVNQTTLAVLRL